MNESTLTKILSDTEFNQREQISIRELIMDMSKRDIIHLTEKIDAISNVRA